MLRRFRKVYFVNLKEQTVIWWLKTGYKRSFAAAFTDAAYLARQKAKADAEYYTAQKAADSNKVSFPCLQPAICPKFRGNETQVSKAYFMGEKISMAVKAFPTSGLLRLHLILVMWIPSRMYLFIFFSLTAETHTSLPGADEIPSNRY